MATNIEITAQLNALLAEQNKLLLVQAKIQKGQLAIMQQMAVAMGQIDVNAMNESLKGVSDQLEAAEEAAKQFGQTTQSAAATAVTSQTQIKTAVNEAADALEAASKKAEEYRINVAAAAAEGAVKGFQFTFSALKGIGGVLDTAIRKFGQFAMAIIRFPIGIWNFLFEKATSGGGGGGLREALEGIRKEFGDLSTGSSKAIIDMAKSMKGELANTGLSVYRTFGNLAERLKTVAELAKALGPLFNTVVSRGLIKSAEAVGAFQKGLGLSNEQMKTLARTAIISGRSIDETQREFANYAIQLGEAFGINTVEISRDMAEMEGDMKHFGGMSRKELGETAVYAKKLGIEVKSLAGIMDQFDNLDSAAEAAARLNQQFGMQLETMRLLKMENPAERMDYLRQSLERTGRSFESLDRRSQAYLATQVGLSQEEAALAFAQENRGLSLDQIKKKSAEAEKKQLSQAEALQKLAGSIERLIKGGGGGVKSLFEAFAQGFERAIFRSREFRQIMRNIRVMLRSTRFAGMEVGRAFVEMFPGVKGILQSLGDLFNPDRWKRTLSKVVDAFKDFFKDLQTNPEAGLKNLFDRLKRAFFDHFDASSGAGRKLIENFKLFFTTILRAILGGLKALIPMVFENLTKLIKGINGFLRGEEGLPIDTTTLGGQIKQMLSELWNVIKEAWPPLWEAIKELFSIVFSKVEAWYEENKLKIWGFLFGPALIRSIAGGLAAALTQSVVKGFTTAAGSSAITKAGQTLVNRITGVTEVADRDITVLRDRRLRRPPPPIPAALRKGAPRTPPVPPPAAEGGLTGFIKRMANINSVDVKKAGVNLLIVAAFLSGAMLIFLGAFAGAALMFENISLAAIAKTTFAIIVMGGMIAAMTGLSKVLSTVNEAALTKSIGSLGILGAMIIGLAGVMWISINMLGGWKESQISGTIKALFAGALLLTVMSVVGMALAAVGAAVKASGGAAALAAGGGLVVVGLMIIGLSYVMKTAIDELSGLDPGKVDVAIKALNAGAELMVVMSVVALAMVGVGWAIAALVSNPVFGLAGAGGLLLGIALIGGLIYGMAPAVKGIMEQIRGMPTVDEDFTKKLDAVNSILSALGTFANIFVKIALTMALVTLLPMLLMLGGPVFAAIGGVVALLGAVGLPYLFSSLIDMFADTIKVISERVNEIQPEKLKLLEALGPVMESMGVLITALQPSPGMLLVGGLFPAETAATIRDYFKELTPILTGENGLIKTAARLTHEMGSISARNFNADAVKAFGSVLSGIGGILQAFSTVFGAAGEGTGQLIVRGITGVFSLGMTEIARTMAGGDAAQEATKLGEFVTTIKGILDAFRDSGLFTNIQEIIRTVGTSVSGMSENTAKAIGPISQIISGIFTFISSFADNMKIDSSVVEAIANGTSLEGIQAAERAVTNLPANVATSIDTVLDSIKNKIGPIISSMLNATFGYTTEEIGRAAKGAEAVMSILTGFSTIMSSLKEAGATETFGTRSVLSSEPPPVLRNFNPATVGSLIGTLGMVINSIFGAGNGQILKTIIEGLRDSGISNLPRGIGEKAKALVDILGMISIVGAPEFGEAISNLQNGRVLEGGVRTATIGTMMQGARTVISAVVNNLGGLFSDREFIRNLSNFSKTNVGRFESLTQTLTSVSGVMNYINTGLGTSVTQAQAQMTNVGAAVTDIITKVTTISNQLSNIEPINLIADLERVGEVIGVGRNSAITIRNDNFTITVNLHVTLDTRDLEAVLVDRRDGRNRFVLSGDPGTPNPSG